ncbi:hypothetical protein LMH73_025765 [Vibrio splendidus]|nr:hypothetical protein [Vibrio splendidus]MCC4880865.1 hypothetical protein [Vibrio splendidus]
MKKLALLSSLLFSGFAFSAVNIPSAPSSPTGYDEIRTSDGVTCRSSVGGNLQVYGGALSMDGSSASSYDDPNYDEQGGFVGFAYSFGGEKRIRCDRLAEIETERAQIELARLKEEIETLKRVRQLKLLEAEGGLPELSRVTQ